MVSGTQRKHQRLAISSYSSHRDNTHDHISHHRGYLHRHPRNQRWHLPSVAGRDYPHMSRLVLHWLFLAIAFALVVRVSILNVREALSEPDVQMEHILGLAMQVVVFTVLGIFQAWPFRPMNYDPTQWAIRAWGWFLEVGNISINYFILALGQAIALGILAYYAWRGVGAINLRDD